MTDLGPYTLLIMKWSNKVASPSGFEPAYSGQRRDNAWPDRSGTMLIVFGFGSYVTEDQRCYTRLLFNLLVEL